MKDPLRLLWHFTQQCSPPKLNGPSAMSNSHAVPFRWKLGGGFTLYVLSLVAPFGPPFSAAAQTKPGEVTKSEGDEKTDKGQQKADEKQEENQESEEGSPVEVTYKDGLRVKSQDGKFDARVRGRAQLRATN